MEPLGTVSEGEWSSLSGVYTSEEADFMAQLLNDWPLHVDAKGGSKVGAQHVRWPSRESSIDLSGIEGRSFCSSNVASSLQFFPQTISYNRGGSSLVFPPSGHEDCYLSDPNEILMNSTKPMNRGSFSLGWSNGLNQEMSDCNVEEPRGGGARADSSIKTSVQPKEESESSEREVAEEEENRDTIENARRRSRTTGNVQKMKRNVKSKKSTDLDLPSRDEEDGNGQGNNQSSSACCSEEESSASHEQNATGAIVSSKEPSVLNLSGKTRASRGSATDPQSLYARKRRDRINERLRILQKLIPNGTKVDISTMLEEAVDYVKFLQLQIKLLSSDELWMYAPIAYNGMDIGLDLKLNIPR